MAIDIDLILTICLITVFIILAGVLMVFLFKHATKNRAYVRTGYGGEIIAQNTGIFILPILHHAVPVSLKVIRLEIVLADETAALTQDNMKVNLSTDFYVKVIAEKESISHVAHTLGDLTLFPEQLKDFLAGQLTHAIRKITAGMTMNEIHKQQDIFVEKIQKEITCDMNKYSLQVDHVALKHFEQSPREFYNEDNAFDAEGLSGLTKIIQSEKKARHEIEQQSLLETKQKDLEMEKLLIDMANKKKRLRLEHEKEIKIFEAANDLIISQDAIKKSTEKKQEKILAEQELELFKHNSEITLSIKLREKLEQKIETDMIKARSEKAQECVKSARKLQKADSEVKIKLLKEKIKDEYETAKIIEIATAKKNAAYEDAEAVRIKAESEAEKLKIIENSKLEAEKLIEDNLKNRYKNEAEGLMLLIDVFNSLSKSELPSDVYPELIGLFSDLCLENNSLICNLGSNKLNGDKSYYKMNSISSKQKSDDDPLKCTSKNKLKAILDDARSSLTKEAIETINDIDQKKSDIFLET